MQRHLHWETFGAVVGEPAVPADRAAVLGLLDPPPGLLRPDRVARVLWCALRSRRQSPVVRPAEPALPVDRS
ncbi:MAG: hypothetical protein GEV09_08075 [Pseudonocardiaceae bacterium]|nr:hypothetical protein [Pseudonocardiaceae bacterium]